MPKRWLFCKIWTVTLALGLGLNVDLSLDQADAGFFLKPLFGPQHDTSPEVERSMFVVTNPRSPVTAKSHFGPFVAEDSIPVSLVQSSLGNQSNFLNNLVVPDLDISAHLVTRSITLDRPQLQVLFHASQLSHDSKNNKNTKTESGAGSNSLLRWCLQLHVERLEQEITSVCVVSAQDNVCIAQLTLPVDWWSEDHIHSVDVLYSVYPIDKNLQCSSASNSIVPGKDGATEERVKSYVGTVTLTNGQLTYQEVKEDQHVLIYIPQKSYYPGSKFRVPVRIQAESDLELFVVRVKARHGLKILGAEANHPDKWRITLDLNNKRHGAMVTAFIHDKAQYTKTDRVQEVFEWLFEVEDGAEDEDPGRIIINIEYEMNSKKEETYGNTDNRVVARVHIQHDNVLTIVPVIKTTEIVNTAILTGKMQSYVMRIYSLSQGGTISDITAQTTCHSGDEAILKVAESCNIVFLDGSETKGSPSVSVIAKYGRHTKFLFFKVWVPEIPLDIELSDNKLSQIKGWKAPKHQRRKARGADFGILTHPGLLLQEEGMMRDEAEEETDEFTTSCHLRFQQAVVEVYAHFFIPDTSRNQYLTHRKAMFRVTHLVEDRLRIADTSIAMLAGNVVEGLRPGRSEVQVLSQMGRVIGAKEIKVGNNKVMIERLQVDVVTGISMSVDADSELPGTLVARVLRKQQLRKKYQEAILDVSILFSDGTGIPLHHIPPSDYFLDMDTLNNHVVAFGPMLAADQPRIIALGQGKGELLKLALELGDACQRKKSRPLAVSYVYIDVDFSKEEEKALQSDGNFHNHASDRYVETDKGTLRVNMEDKPTDVKPHSASDADKTDSEASHIESIPIDDDLADLAGDAYDEKMQEPSHEAQQQHVSETRGLTALEIGMYVLLGVFCLAIVVFMVNCMVFVWRYRRKRMPYETSDSIANAQDWVWIGRATLERNAINTQCSQTLMPESDFNGNQSTNLLHPSTATLPRENTGTTSARNSGSASNRNSVVSTYKGSECSIRITSNPHPDANPEQKESGEAQTAPDNQAHNDAQNKITQETLMEESSDDTMDSEEPPPLPPKINKMAYLAAAAAAAGHPLPPGSPQPGPSNINLIRRSLVAADASDLSDNNNLSDVEWDYEAMGLSYDQLMEYFDNLKESTA